MRAARSPGACVHCRVPAHDALGAAYYAYHVDGPADPARGHRFDPSKVLFDPHAPALYFPPGVSRDAAAMPGSNAGRAPLGVLPHRRRAFDWAGDHPVRHEADAVIYELHVRHFTRRASSGVSEAARGTYAGVIEKIPYLTALGVTVVELMPVFQGDPGEPSAWGYMPLHFFSPEQRYACASEQHAVEDEFRAMVRALHAADIEVILDVVYNHTAEGDERGPTYSYRGVDNSTYYLLCDDRRSYRNDTGTHNVLRCAHPHVRSLILDSLRFWVTEMHVDGFRFDLASIFSRNEDGSLALGEPAITSEISSDPTFTHVRLIAEPWDVVSYALGRNFPGIGWAQWNGRFRDDVRAFVRGDAGMVGSVMTRMYGSDDVFPDRKGDVYHPYQSVNFVTSHDGFTLYDLVAYDAKHNEANGEGNADGTDDNVSWNCGWEGDDGAPAEVLALRVRQAKSFLALLLLANGTPMFRAGDEFLQTQRGNNNPYNQDDETTWLDWARVDRHADVLRFAREMIAFRKAHPSLSRSTFWRDDVHWYGVRGAPDLSPASHAFAYSLRGAGERDVDLYVMANSSSEPLDFEIQEGRAGSWALAIDTGLATPADIAAPAGDARLDGLTYRVHHRSVAVLVRVGDPG